jgi:hypothetical protein
MPEESTSADLVERTNSGNFDAMASFFAPAAVWVTDEGIGTFRGVGAIRDHGEALPATGLPE